VQSARRFAISASLAFAAIVAVSCPIAFASAPISTPSDQIWKRSILGTVYAAQNHRQLTALCVEVDGFATWIPTDLLRDIRDPDIEKATFWEGIGFVGIDRRIPNWGDSGLSLELPTQIETNGNFDEGPSYFFVIDKRRVLYRVLFEWVPEKGNPDIKVQRETWVPIQKAAARGGKCAPPRAGV
jgi:hypothetical protein